MAHRIILDVDTGTDDAVALMVAALSPDIELVGATTVNGNTLVHNCTENTLRVFDHIGKSDIPVYEGMSLPLARPGIVDGVEEPHRAFGLRLTIPFSALGGPSLSVPCGFSVDDLPIGLQIAGRRWDEPTVLRVGYAYEQATDWHRRRPPLA